MSKTILFVDDSQTMVMVVRSTLETSGYTVKTANDGLQALAVLKGGCKPDLMITDINMPNMNGLDLIRSVRAMTDFRFMPILTLTTEANGAIRDEGRKAGATGWMVKPVAPADMLKLVKRVIPDA